MTIESFHQGAVLDRALGELFSEEGPENLLGFGFGTDVGMLREGFPELTSLEMLASRVEERYVSNFCRLRVAFSSAESGSHTQRFDGITVLTAALCDHCRRGFYDMSTICSAFLSLEGQRSHYPLGLSRACKQILGSPLDKDQQVSFNS